MFDHNTDAVCPLTDSLCPADFDTVVVYHDCLLLLQGTRNLVAAAVQAKVKKFVLVTSIGTDDPLFPLNLLFGVRCNGLC